MTATSASVRFDARRRDQGGAFVRLTGRTHVQCCIYADIAPILTVQDGACRHHDHHPRPGPGDRRRRDLGRLLAEAADRYAAELEKFATADRATTDPDEPGGQAA